MVCCSSSSDNEDLSAFEYVCRAHYARIEEISQEHVDGLINKYTKLKNHLVNMGVVDK